ECSHNHLEIGNVVKHEFMHHMPYGIFSVAFGIGLLTILDFTSTTVSNVRLSQQMYDRLFHSFHFLHILFASTGAILSFSKFSTNMLKGLIVGTVSPAFF